MIYLRQEVKQKTKDLFDKIRGKGYFYMGCGGRYNPSWTNEVEKLSRHFSRGVADKISKVLKPSGEVYRLMQQGCGHARSLEYAVNSLARSNPNTVIEGYAVGGCIDDIWLPRDFNAKPTIPINASKAYCFEGSHKNSKLFGLEEDISTLMKDFPYPLNLVFSDNTYMHLPFEWLAFKRTVEKLSKNGAFLVRSIDSPINLDDTDKMSEEKLIWHLRKLNPSYEIFSSMPSSDFHQTILVIRREDTKPFLTGFSLRKTKENGSTRVREYSGKIMDDSMALDEF